MSSSSSSGRNTGVIVQRSLGSARRRSRRTRGGLNGASAVNGGTDSGTAVTNAIPSLREFMHRQAVLQQYRGILKCVRRFPDPADVKQYTAEVRREFRSNQSVDDKLQIQMRMQEGERKLQELQSMVGMNVSSSKTTATTTTKQASSNDAGDSWLNIKDEKDVRGRVGANWPWKR